MVNTVISVVKLLKLSHLTKHIVRIFTILLQEYASVFCATIPNFAIAIQKAVEL